MRAVSNKTAGKLSRYRLSLDDISIYLYKFMSAGYQQAAEMIIKSNIRTQEDKKARHFTGMFSKHGGPSNPDQEAILAFLLIKWRCHIKLIWKPRRRTI